MDVKVKEVTHDFVVFEWECYEIKVYRSAPATFIDRSGNRHIHYPPKWVMKECYRLGRGIMKNLEEQQKKKVIKEKSFTGWLL